MCLANLCNTDSIDNTFAPVTSKQIFLTVQVLINNQYLHAAHHFSEFFNHLRLTHVQVIRDEYEVETTNGRQLNSK